MTEGKRPGDAARTDERYQTSTVMAPQHTTSFYRRYGVFDCLADVIIRQDFDVLLRRRLAVERLPLFGAHPKTLIAGVANDVALDTAVCAFTQVVGTLSLCIITDAACWAIADQDEPIPEADFASLVDVGGSEYAGSWLHGWRSWSGRCQEAAQQRRRTGTELPSGRQDGGGGAAKSGERADDCVGSGRAARGAAVLDAEVLYLMALVRVGSYGRPPGGSAQMRACQGARFNSRSDRVTVGNFLWTTLADRIPLKGRWWCSFSAEFQDLRADRHRVSAVAKRERVHHA